MNTLQNEIINTRKIYRELFNNARSAIERQIDSLKKASLCNHCKQGCDIDFNKITVLQKFPDGCRYKFWQESVLNLLENQISKDIYERIQIIEKRRQTYSCACCSSCCKLASSEYSFEELKQRAHKLEKIKKDAEELAAKLEGVSLKIATKVSSTGTIFGSVGNIQIAEELAKLGHNIDRKIIVVKDAVKEVGNYKAIVKLHKEVSVEIPFEVVAEEA